jgi:hypothetical protein
MVIDPLVVRIIDTVTGKSWVYVFPVGPVSVGCGLDSALPIARPGVAARHGTFLFDDHAVRYQDLEGGSGTLVDGAPPRGREKVLTDWSAIQIGDIRITTSRRAPDERVPDPSLSPFARPVGTAVPPRGHDREPAPRERRSSRPDRPAAKKARSQPRPRVKTRSSPLVWLFAIAIGLGAVAAAGLVLQFRGLPWMPPEVLARVPPWLADWFR